MTKDGKIFTTGEAAKLCNVNFRTISRWIDKGYLDAYALPGRGDKRITREALIAFLNKHHMPIPDPLTADERRILVVEDEKAMAKAIARTLTRAGYEINIAQDGFIAGTLLASFSPALITLDLRMPHMDGYEVLRFLKKNTSYSHIKILIISAESHTNLQLAKRLGADECLEKPFSNKVLMETVQQLLEE